MQDLKTTCLLQKYDFFLINMTEDVYFNISFLMFCETPVSACKTNHKIENNVQFDVKIRNLKVCLEFCDVVIFHDFSVLKTTFGKTIAFQ